MGVSLNQLKNTVTSLKEYIDNKSSNVSVTQSLTSGTEIGSIKVDNEETKLYAPSSTDTSWEKVTDKPFETLDSDSLSVDEDGVLKVTKSAELGEITDVELSSPSDKQLLEYDAEQSKWVNTDNNFATQEDIVDVNDTIADLSGNTYKMVEYTLPELSAMAKLILVEDEFPQRLSYTEDELDAILDQIDFSIISDHTSSSGVTVLSLNKYHNYLRDMVLACSTDTSVMTISEGYADPWANTVTGTVYAGQWAYYNTNFWDASASTVGVSLQGKTIEFGVVNYEKTYVAPNYLVIRCEDPDGNTTWHNTSISIGSESGKITENTKGVSTTFTVPSDCAKISFEIISAAWASVTTEGTFSINNPYVVDINELSDDSSSSSEITSGSNNTKKLTTLRVYSDADADNITVTSDNETLTGTINNGYTDFDLGYQDTYTITSATYPKQTYSYPYTMDSIIFKSIPKAGNVLFSTSGNDFRDSMLTFIGSVGSSNAVTVSDDGVALTNSSNGGYYDQCATIAYWKVDLTDVNTIQFTTKRTNTNGRMYFFISDSVPQDVKSLTGNVNWYFSDAVASTTYTYTATSYSGEYYIGIKNIDYSSSVNVTTITDFRLLA